MKFKLDFPIKPIDLKLTFAKEVLLIGSCFSDEMGASFRSSGFHVCDNPFGTIFHPAAIARVLSDAINDVLSVDLLTRGDLYFSWGASGKLYATDEGVLRKKVLSTRQEIKKILSEAELAVITFGTAWAYVLNDSGKIVANCHKVPQDRFSRKLSEVNEMVSEWQNLVKQIKELNPDIQIIFTVSPVRHVRDGLVENNRSKARLIELVHSLSEDQVHYFPSYEILIDELRDHRYFASDLVHPSKEATAYVWERFKEYLFDTNTAEAVVSVEKVKRSMAHKSLYPGSAEEVKRREALMHAKDILESDYPGVNWA